MLPRIVVFVGLATLVLFGLHYYIYARLARYLALGAGEQRTLKIALGLMFALLWLAMPFSRLLRLSAIKPVLYASYIWLGVLVLFAVVLFASDVARLVMSSADRLRELPDPSRRVFFERLLGVGSLGMTGLLSGYALWQGLRRVAVKPVQISLTRLPAELEGFRIVQLTDLHVGPTIDGVWLRDVVSKVNALNPDVVAITGDLVDGSVEKLRQQVAPLGDLKAAHGVFFVTGNHEYYSGADEWIAELTRLGVRVLRNERVTVSRGAASIDIAGIDDHHSASFPGHGPDLPRALAGRPADRPVVLLAHQPIAVHQAAEHKVDLQLSGHTHGGQIWPWGLFVRLQQPYIAGVHREGDTTLYVSCGTGYWGPPMRLGAPAEITALTLSAKTA
jgi:predicted MPP superfamily phosphohydrolase